MNTNGLKSRRVPVYMQILSSQSQPKLRLAPAESHFDNLESASRESHKNGSGLQTILASFQSLATTALFTLPTHRLLRTLQ